MSSDVDGTRLLALVRHAAAAGAEGSDRDRPLTPEGVRDATGLGRWLAERLPRLDAVTCSSAVRARETWQHAAAALPSAPEPQYLDALYEGGADDLLDQVAAAAPAAAVLVLVGHNPAVEQVADRLTDGASPGFRPGAAALIRLEHGWGQRTGATVTASRRPGR